MILYQITNYLDYEEWTRHLYEARTAAQHFMDQNPQELCWELQIVRCGTNMTPTQAMIESINRRGWVEDREVIWRARPN